MFLQLLFHSRIECTAPVVVLSKVFIFIQLGSLDREEVEAFFDDHFMFFRVVVRNAELLVSEVVRGL